LKKILIITSDYFPKKSPRSHRASELSIELALQGNIVNILTHRNSLIHDDFEKNNNVKLIDFKYYEWQKWLKNTLVGILIYKVLCRFYLFQYYFLVRQSLPGLENYDVVITVSSPFSIAWGMASFSKKRIKSQFNIWIADLGDPFMLNKGLKNKPLFLFHFFEWNMLRKTNFVTIPFDEMKVQFYSSYGYKFKTIPQGVRIIPIPLAYVPNSPIKIGFSGHIYPGIRDIFSFFDFLLEKNYDFQLIVYTNQHFLFETYKKYIGNKLILKEYVERSQLITELSSLDFLVAVNFNSVGGNRTAVPSKLIDYSLAKRPILLYEQSNLPLDRIQEFMQHNFENQYIVDIQMYDIKVVAQKFIRLFNN
jgi:hypothetical protein